MSDTREKLMKDAESEWLGKWKEGPTRLRWDSLPLQVGDRAPDVQLLDQSGQTVNLSTFWADAPVLIIFWRHFGCSCGMDRAKRLIAEYDSYTALGGKVFIIGQGEPERAASYAQAQQLPCPVLCDPDFNAYHAFDLLDGKPSQIVFDAPDEFLRRDFQAGVSLAEARRGSPGAVVDSPWQLPGEFVIDQNGIVQLAYRYQYCEDWPNPLVLLAAMKEAVAQIVMV